MKRNILAIVLIGLVIILTPVYYRLIAPESTTPADGLSGQESVDTVVPATSEQTDLSETTTEKPEIELTTIPAENQDSITNYQNEKQIKIETELYIVTISNRSAGTIVDYHLKGYTGTFNQYGEYLEDDFVELINNDDEFCKPCLGLYDIDEKEYHLFDAAFEVDFLNGESIYLMPEDSLVLNFSLNLDNGVEIKKQLTLFGDSYVSHHKFKLQGLEETYRKNLELLWLGGLMPTEKLEISDSQNSAAIVYQIGELDDIKLTKDKAIKREIFDGVTSWVAIKNKYFLSALLPATPGKYGALSAGNIFFGERKLTPIYNVAIGFDVANSNISSALYLGPQDYQELQNVGDSLEDAMNWGIKVIRPISKFIMRMLTFMHNPYGEFYINYGIVLILFAIIVRVITGPLTKKSFESSKKMQVIQPKIKALQAKYKNDPQRFQKEQMALWKKEGVNPLGGCLPMIIQMPLLFALFVVFRNTIEFRGAGFILWISDLSLPDVVFELPFSIPIYGSGVAILPIFMGITMFLQQRLSAATMDPKQKPMMYMMTGFFFLIFNQFPSGLNLYYAVMNILGILQQRSIKLKK